jgi:hypothetical protein
MKNKKLIVDFPHSYKFSCEITGFTAGNCVLYYLNSEFTNIINKITNNTNKIVKKTYNFIRFVCDFIDFICVKIT